MKSIGLITLLNIVASFHFAVCQTDKSANEHRVNFIDMILAGRNDNNSFDFTRGGVSRAKNRTIEIQKITFSEGIDLDTLTYLLQNHARLQALQDLKDRKVLRTTIKIPPELPLQSFVELLSRLGRRLDYVFDLKSNELLIYMLPRGDDRKNLLVTKPKVFELNSREGLVDYNGDTLIAPVYEYLVFQGDGLVLARKQSKVGVLSVKNEVLIPFRYDYIHFFREGRAAGMLYVEQNNKAGIISMSEQVIVPVVYDDLIGVNGDGLYMFLKDEKWGWLTLEKELVPPKYKSVIPLYLQGTLPAFLVETESGYEIRDLNDKLKGDFGHFDRVERYDNLLVTESKTGTGIIDIYGKVILPPVYDEIVATHRYRFWYVSMNGKYGVLDAHTAKLAVPLKYKGRGEGYGSDSSDVFSFKKRDAKTGKFYYGVVNKNNKIILPFKYDAISSYNGDFIVIQKDGKYGAIDRNGRMVVNLEYDYLECVRGAVAQVYKLNGKYGYIHENGRLMTEPLFDQPEVFGHEYNRITVMKGGEQVCLTSNGDLRAGACK